MNPIILRPYQIDAIKSLTSKFTSNSCLRTYLSAPTGSGKSVMMAEFILNSYIKKGERVFIYCHSTILMYQLMISIEERAKTLGIKLSNDDFGHFCSETHDINKLRAKEGRFKIDSFREDFRIENSVWVPKILFSTTQSLFHGLDSSNRRLRNKLTKFRPSLIVIDEIHYGKGGELEKRIFKFFNDQWPNSGILGLSATPKVRRTNNWDMNQVVRAAYFYDLVKEGFLARPEFIDVLIPSKCGVRVSQSEDVYGFKKINYSELVRDALRNREIAKHYFENRNKYKKTLIFAIDTQHANLLGKELQRLGIESYIIHNDIDEDPYELLEKFKRLKHVNTVAIVVRMAIEGVDIPDLNTVILAKPVTSEIEFAQMVGRGSRITETKNMFYVVDCYDSCEREGNSNFIYHNKDFFNGANDRDEVNFVSPSGPTAATPSSSRSRPNQHSIDGYTFTTLNYQHTTSPFFYALNGLRINAKQTFGIEIELALKDGEHVDTLSDKNWRNVALKLIEQLKLAGVDIFSRPFDDPDDVPDHSKWALTKDRSAAFELVSPILKGEKGFEEMVNVMLRLSDSFLNEIGLCIDWRCGFHLNLGWDKYDFDSIKKIIKVTRAIEPALNSLVSASRVIDSEGYPAHYCQSLRSLFSERALNSFTSREFFKMVDEDENRYWAINFQNRDGKGQRLEVRLHQGTIEPKKIALWTALWMNYLSSIVHGHFDQFIENTHFKKSIALPETSLNSDIVALAKNHMGLDSNTSMLNDLNQRRRELISNSHWQKVLGDTRSHELIRYWDKIHNAASIV